jgi:hypothetical protein
MRFHDISLIYLFKFSAKVSRYVTPICTVVNGLHYGTACNFDANLQCYNARCVYICATKLSNFTLKNQKIEEVK